MSEIDNEEDTFPSFNGMNRPAMAFGIPMVTGIFTALFIILSFFGGLSLNLGFYSLFLPLLGVVFLIFLKVISEDDPNALAFIKWRFRAIFIKIFQGNAVIYLTSNDLNRRKYNANRQFKKL